jgi:hypothetical protein
MEIIIEIGTPEQQGLIVDEISQITNVLKDIVPERIKKIYVPLNFDDKVNEIQKSNSYRSYRGHHTASAKTLINNEGIVIVLSAQLYTSGCDQFIRYNTFFHELFHAYNPNFGKIFNESDRVTNTYLNNLYVFFDEYQAVRRSYEVTFEVAKSLSLKFLRNVCYNFHSHSISLTDKALYYDKINAEISVFLRTRNAGLFLKNFEQYFLECGVDFIYTYAIMDACEHFTKYKYKLSESPFVNSNSMKLIDFYRKKFDGNYNLNEGYDFIVDFTKVFGIFFYIKDGVEHFYVEKI